MKMHGAAKERKFLMLYDSLRYFCAVVKNMNITQAAEQLHMSQQTLSNYIARLESEYGIRLFERKPHLHLTYAGECFYAHVQKVLQGENELLAEFDEIRSQRQGRLSVGITQTRSQSMLPLVLPEFIKQNASVRFEAKIYHVSELENRLLAGEFHIAVRPVLGISDSPRVCRVTLQSDQLCLVIPQKFLNECVSASEAAELKKLPPDAAFEQCRKSGILQKVPYILSGSRILKTEQEFFSKYAPAPHILIELKNTEVIYALQYAEMGAIFLFRSMLHLLPPQPQPPLVVPLPMPEAFIPLAALWDSRCGLDWPARKFIALARKILAER